MNLGNENVEQKWFGMFFISFFYFLARNLDWNFNRNFSSLKFLALFGFIF